MDVALSRGTPSSEERTTINSVRNTQTNLQMPCYSLALMRHLVTHTHTLLVGCNVHTLFLPAKPTPPPTGQQHLVIVSKASRTVPNAPKPAVPTKHQPPLVPFPSRMLNYRHYTLSANLSFQIAISTCSVCLDLGRKSSKAWFCGISIVHFELSNGLSS
eukprot:6356855-Amphidinium_carterae.1